MRILADAAESNQARGFVANYRRKYEGYMPDNASFTIDVMVRSHGELMSDRALKSLTKRVAQIALEERGIAKAELSVLYINDAEMTKLNLQYRHRQGTTDTLSFALGESPGPKADKAVLGDIVISVERAAQQARQAGHSLRREIAFLIVHSLLHLLDFDHEKGERKAKQMQKAQEECFAAVCRAIKL
ncbi:MAG: rRNA maturation RNase YbeY [Candidatus Sumerlaeota bacterium]|nr:rRNA maturation RNase YbeY [Candidatus Sumerlaeota bacterium]